MAALGYHFLNEIELSMLGCILQSTWDDRLSTFDKVQIV